MKALVLAEVGRFVLTELPDPEPGPGQVLIRVTGSGICGSEFAGFLGTDGLRRPGLVFGHELVGTIEAYGPGGGGSDGQDRPPLGTPVAANPLRSCLTCRTCRGGQPNVCPDRRLLGAHVDGGNAELVVVPVGSVHRVDRLPHPEATVLAEPAGCAIHAVGQTHVGAGDSALVIGTGPIGLLLIEVLRIDGVAPVYFTEPNDARAAAAAAGGGLRLSCQPSALREQILATTKGSGVDCVFDAVGSTETRTVATQCVRAGGEICFAGLHDADTPLPVRDLIRSEVTCATSFAYRPEDLARAVHLVGHGAIRMRGEVVRANLVDGQAWYERLIAGHPAAKVILQPQPG